MDINLTYIEAITIKWEIDSEVNLKGAYKNLDLRGYRDMKLGWTILICTMDRRELLCLYGKYLKKDTAKALLHELIPFCLRKVSVSDDTSEFERSG